VQIVQAAELPVKVRESSGRVGSYGVRDVMKGEPGRLDNFSLKIYDQNGSFASPRHRHNFDQFRYQIEGDADFGQTGKMKPGTLGYFPEGAHYGPQSGSPHVVAVLQFGGPSGSGYLGSGESRGANRELRQTGVFEGGIYRRNEGVEGKRNQDAYEAVWEHAMQRRLVYPKPQYDDPILMQTSHYPWLPVDGCPGVAERALGTFTSAKIRAAQYKLEPGAQFRASGRGIYLFLSGNGGVGKDKYLDLTALYLDSGEDELISAATDTEIVLMGLTDPALIAAPADPSQSAS
jgi:hypothetical protein